MELLKLWWECKIVWLPWKAVWKTVPGRIKLDLPLNPTFPLPGIYSGEMKIDSYKNLYMVIFVAQCIVADCHSSTKVDPEFGSVAWAAVCSQIKSLLTGSWFLFYTVKFCYCMVSFFSTDISLQLGNNHFSLINWTLQRSHELPTYNSFHLTCFYSTG